MADISELLADFEILEGDDRYEFILEQARSLEPMPDALKTSETKVKGCVSNVWAYPVRNPDGSLHFYADSDSQLTRGLIALVIGLVQDRQPADIVGMNLLDMIKPFAVGATLTAGRSNNLPNMIALIRETAERLA